MSSWDTSNVSYMTYMFYYATVFNQDIRNWDVSNVNNFSWMFAFTKMREPPLNAPVSDSASLHQAWFNS